MSLHKKQLLEHDPLSVYGVLVEEDNGNVQIWTIDRIGGQKVTLTEKEFLWLLREGWKMFDNPNAREVSELLTQQTINQ